MVAPGQLSVCVGAVQLATAPQAPASMASGPMLAGQPPIISGCPANIGPLAMDAGACGAVASWTAPTQTDNCPGATIAQTVGPASGSLFPAGPTTITYTATDAAGNTATCTFTVTVNADAQPPIISGCPANIGPLAMDAGACGAVANWTAPTQTDNCPGATIAQTGGPASGSLFPAGPTTITYTATDAAGNTATCTFTVTVNADAQPPIISGCPANIGPLAMDAGACGAVATWAAPA